MIRAYSQRLLPPYSGAVQIAESERARAVSYDGLVWDIQFLSGNLATNWPRPKGHGLDRGYFKVAHIEEGKLTNYIWPAILDATEVAESIDELFQYLASAKIPFPTADIYEYWLLDDAGKSPLALIFSCCEAEQMDSFPLHTDWTALPHSKLKIANTEAEQTRQEGPVNHRLQRQIASRAGYNPKAAWFNRSQTNDQEFPCFLIREDWGSAIEQDLCQRYLERMAPRLLMLQGVPKDDRERMEVAARKQALEVNEFFPLYPEINNEARMTAIRVEARLRLSAGQPVKTASKDKPADDKRMSKDMRIFET